MDSDIVEYVREENKDLTSYFLKASKLWNWTPQEISDYKESYFRSMLSKYYPFPYKITKWIIRWGHQGWLWTDSIDCIICCPNHPDIVDIWWKNSFILADGVEAAIEIKWDFKNKEVVRGLKQLLSVKDMPIKKKKCYDPKLPAIIYCEKTYENVHKLLDTIVTYYETDEIRWDRQFDAIVVHNKYIIINSYPGNIFPNFFIWINQKYLVCYYNEDTLCAFLYFLFSIKKTDGLDDKNILKNYISFMTPLKDETFKDINERLSKITRFIK